VRELAPSLQGEEAGDGEEKGFACCLGACARVVCGRGGWGEDCQWYTKWVGGERAERACVRTGYAEVAQELDDSSRHLPPDLQGHCFWICNRKDRRAPMSREGKREWWDVPCAQSAETLACGVVPFELPASGLPSGMCGYLS
jgi:hypothetical protein